MELYNEPEKCGLKAGIQVRQDTMEQHRPKLLWRLYALIKKKDTLSKVT